MIFAGWARRCAVGIFLCVGLSGCFPDGDSQLDEKKEPHFISGMNLVNQTDYTGAIEEFEKTLEENPRNASARFELGWLYEDKANDPAAAIYNYDRYLKFSSNQDKADLVKQHITSCKLELTKSVSAVGTQPSGAQREFDRITAENRDLRTQVTNLQTQLAQAKAAAVAVASAHTYSDTVTPEPPAPPVDPNPPRVVVTTPHVDPLRNAPPRTTAGMTHSYVVKERDTLAAIARKNGISIEALTAANPRVKPTHLLVGQTLKIPAP